MATPAPNVNPVPWWEKPSNTQGKPNWSSNANTDRTTPQISSAPLPIQPTGPPIIPGPADRYYLHNHHELFPTHPDIVSSNNLDTEAYAQQRYYERTFQRPEKTAKTKWEALQLMGIVPKDTAATAPTSSSIISATVTAPPSTSSVSSFESMCDALEIPEGHATVNMVIPERNNMQIPVSQSYYLGMRRGAQLDLYPDRERFNISTRMEGRRVFTRDDIRPNLPPF